MSRANLADAVFSVLADFDPTTFSAVKAKINEHDTALDAIGAPTVSTETVTSGALTLTAKTSFLSITGGVAFTLPDGTVVGQEKVIECSVAATSPVGTLTITTPNTAGPGGVAEPATHAFRAVGARLVLVWLATGWHITGKLRAGRLAVVVGTTVLTGEDMVSNYDLSVTGTVSSTTTKGIPAPCTVSERIHVTCPTAASTPLGNIAIAGTTIATGVAATSLAGINATTVQASFESDGTSWQNTALTTATFS